MVDRQRLLIWLKPLALGVGLFVGVVAIMLGLAWQAYWRTTYPILHPTRSTLVATSPMGWNSWRAFACDDDFTDQTIRETVDAMVAQGYVERGYTYIVLDDCWQANRSDEGEIQVDDWRFPSGIAALAKYIHDHGMLFGVYTSAGRLTCEDRPGSYGYEKQDIATYAKWGVDLIKLDWCGVDNLDMRQTYQQWRKLLDEQQRPIILSLATDQAEAENELDAQIWLWGSEVGEMWRTTTDSKGSWTDMLRVFDVNTLYAPYQRPGAWNDADLLRIGTDELDLLESQTHFSLWIMMNSPLFISADLRSQPEEIKTLLTNPTAIAIHQDPLGSQAEVVWQMVGIQILSKPLQARGSRAVLLLNRNDEPTAITLHPNQLGLLPLVTMKDVWAEANQDWQFGPKTYVVPAHGSKLFIVRGIDSVDSLEKILPSLESPVVSGNLTQQKAVISQGVFEYDSALEQGSGLGVKTNSSFRYHLNGACSRFTAEFEYLDRNQSPNLGMVVEVYLDGQQLNSQLVDKQHPIVRIDEPLSRGRVLDLVTHYDAKSYNTMQYGRWHYPMVICGN